ncbi:MAG: hypothetical protein EAZ89_11620 [Bacteroidetes bacterium]|nr:MAG: hypothetical protein EAZ89_11620 [Bacteroidota bacterium]
MNVKMNRWIWLVVIGVASVAACQQNGEYKRIVERELKSGKRNDSLFLGLSLGMSRDSFYTHCWALNRQQLIKDGPGNLSAQHEIQDFGESAYLNFYPDFYENKIYEMDISFRYKSWAPWNRHLWSDSLETKVVQLFEKWYGPGFFKVKDGKGKNYAYVKIDGNRRISLYQYDDELVKGKITDLTVEKQALEAQKKAEEARKAKQATP